MNNPYDSMRMRSWRKSNKLLHVLGLVVLLPKFLLWKIKKWLSVFAVKIRVQSFFYALTKPFRAVWGFVKIWCVGRPWKNLWLASPVLILAMVGFTTYFISANSNRGGVEEGYYRSAMEAMNEGDAKQADFLLGKLIHHKNYSDNDQVLLHAWMASTANGNKPRAQALRQKLVGERGYEPAKRWLISSRLQQGEMNPEEADELTAMARAMVDSALTDSDLNYWKKTLVRLLRSQQKSQGAVEVLRDYEQRDPEASLLLVQSYFGQGAQDSALEELDTMLDYVLYEDPELDLYLREYVEGLALKSQNTADLVVSADLLKQAISIIERKRSLTADRQNYDAWLGELYIRMFEKLLEFRDAERRLEAFGYFDRAITMGSSRVRCGTVLNQIIDPASGYPLLSGQILDVVVKRGGVSAHLARGMDSWVEGSDKSARLHFSIAKSLDPKAMEVMRYAALYLAREGSSAITVFTGMNRSSYQRSFELLDIAEEIDHEQWADVLLDRCYIYSVRSQWKEILLLLEPRMEELEGQEKLRGYDWLVRAYTGLEDKENAEKYQRALQNEASKLREQEHE
ncbi:hypothetical protein [Rubritalea sp.]|uniref:hypothetical protein n=1 Tax=Rubritalea sp. TaxID=2109375 RepID=UPI003EF48C8C